ncbi:hypothetical protein K501DRAFT_298534 [Backusella circina FSU 941]|nr:hypothetical protein K501DRAFT_298534 [Backusella circina FSU 941]
MTELNVSEKTGDTRLSEASSNIKNSNESVIDNLQKEYHITKDEESQITTTRRLLKKYRIFFHFFLWLTFTGFVCAAFALQIPKGYNQENLVLGLIYAWFTLYIIFCHVKTTVVTAPWHYCISFLSEPLQRYMTPFARTLTYAILVFSVMAATIFTFPEKPESPRMKRLISLFGIIVFLTTLFALSKHRRSIQWNVITTCILLQFLLALFVFRTSVGHDIFRWIADLIESYLHMAWYGTSFVFGEAVANSGIFAVSVFPALIFFASTVQVLYYLGTIQWLLKKAGVIFMAILSISASEATIVVASPFLGACEGVLMIEPFLPTLTKSEIHQILTSGFATISGSVLYGYISMGVSGQALLTSCVMSIPCSVAISKLRYPEVEESQTREKFDIPDHSEGTTNLLHAVGKGAEAGVKIALLIMGNLISILAILYAVNGFLTWVGHFLNIQELTLQLVTGYLFVPIAWLIGVDNKDVVVAGRLMATKIWANEFVAYMDMTSTYKNMLSVRSELVVTYALCGFANLGSVGMQVGIMSALAPERSGDFSRLAVSALICGSLSTWFSAAIAGMLI